MNTIIDTVILPKLTINRHMSKTVLNSPPQLGGIAYPKFEAIQMIKGIMFLLHQTRWNGPVGNVIHVVLSVLQLMSGHVRLLMEDTTTQVDYIEGGWMFFIQEQFQQINGSMWIEHQWTPPLQRVHDTSIMVSFTAIPGVTK